MESLYINLAYVAPDLQVIAYSANGLQNNQLITAISKTELYDGSDDPVVDRVWTNTRKSGVISNQSKDCNDWTTEDADQVGNFGISNKMTEEWTEDAENSGKCNTPARLYCFEQPPFDNP